jgi:hypothetical protein
MTKILTLSDVTEYPLCWPETKPRAAQRASSSPFNNVSLAHGLREIADEMKRWRAADYIVSMSPGYVRGPKDPGVAVWWSMPQLTPEEALRCIACDNWPWPEVNAHAIYLTLNRLRSFERYGTYTKEQAAEGARLALPAPPDPDAPPPWWETIGVERGWPLAAIEAIYKGKAEKMHPDRATDEDERSELTKRLAILNAAMDQCRKDLEA